MRVCGGSKFDIELDNKSKIEPNVHPKDIFPLHLDGISVSGMEDRIISTWLGGTVLTSLSTFKDMWVTKADYDEIGPDVVNRKCF